MIYIYVLLNKTKSDTISYYMSKKKYTIYTIWIKKIYYKNTIFIWFWSGRPEYLSSCIVDDRQTEGHTLIFFICIGSVIKILFKSEAFL